MTGAMLITGGILGYTFVAAVFLKVLRAYDRRVRRNEDSDGPIIAGIWPLTLPICLLVQFAKGAYWMVDRMPKAIGNSLYDRRARRTEREIRLLEKIAVNQPPLEISIPKGAAMTAEAYRKLKPMVNEFERSLPMGERE